MESDVRVAAENGEKMAETEIHWIKKKSRKKTVRITAKNVQSSETTVVFDLH